MTFRYQEMRTHSKVNPAVERKGFGRTKARYWQTTHCEFPWGLAAKVISTAISWFPALLHQDMMIKVKCPATELRWKLPKAKEPAVAPGRLATKLKALTFTSVLGPMMYLTKRPLFWVLFMHKSWDARRLEEVIQDNRISIRMLILLLPLFAPDIIITLRYM